MPLPVLRAAAGLPGGAAGHPRRRWSGRPVRAPASPPKRSTGCCGTSAGRPAPRCPPFRPGRSATSPPAGALRPPAADSPLSALLLAGSGGGVGDAAPASRRRRRRGRCAGSAARQTAAAGASRGGARGARRRRAGLRRQGRLAGCTRSDGWPRTSRGWTSPARRRAPGRSRPPRSGHRAGRAPRPRADQHPVVDQVARVARGPGRPRPRRKG